jgi:hypothetical protein
MLVYDFEINGCVLMTAGQREIFHVFHAVHNTYSTTVCCDPSFHKLEICERGKLRSRLIAAQTKMIRPYVRVGWRVDWSINLIGSKSS